MTDGIKIDLDYWISEVQNTKKLNTELSERCSYLEKENDIILEYLAGILADKYRVKKKERTLRIAAFMKNDHCISSYYSIRKHYYRNDKSFTIDWNKFCKDFEIEKYKK